MAAAPPSSLPDDDSGGGEATTKKCIAILTSGGDSQGMNAALRAVARVALYKGMKPYLVKEGYNGLVKGGAGNIKECKWGDVSNIMQKGGTVIGTVRCDEFRTPEGRLKAAGNLVKAGINNLVIIGGDGSLTGADIFKKEWNEFLQKLVSDGQITADEASSYPYLNIVGLVGSIDNDMCGTDMTIGADTALHRIVEAVDCIISTASSHQRTFVMEVMGRNCGYLTVMAGIACNADWVCVPENPPRHGWEDTMCEKLKQCRDKDQRLNCVLVAEGAKDQDGKKITLQYVKEVIEKKLSYDTRITVLGHVQRGGQPSAYDRILGTRMGAAAAETLLEATCEIDPVLIAIQGNSIKKESLMECVERTKKINEAIKKCDFDQVTQLCDSISRNMRLLEKLETCPVACSDEGSTSQKYTLAVMNVGAPAGGMNSCTRSFVRLLLHNGHTVLGIQRGFDGLADGEISPLSWSGVNDWGSIGGSKLGTTRTLPSDQKLPDIAEALQKNGVQALLVIGGFGAFQAILKLEDARSKYKALHIPIIQVAATISNNVPGTDYSLGCDTALNVIVSLCDTLKQSASASRKRVFIVETMGGFCGYLTTMGGLAAGADSVYIYEKDITIHHLLENMEHLVNKFKAGNYERGLILRNEKCNENYTTKFMEQILAQEGKEFTTRSSVLGHLQQGGNPSPSDRIMGAKYAHYAVDKLLEQIQSSMTESGEVEATTSNTVCVLGLRGSEYKFTPVADLKEETDMEHRIPHDQWWMTLKDLVHVLSQHKGLDFKGETSEQPQQETSVSQPTKPFGDRTLQMSHDQGDPNEPPLSGDIDEPSPTAATALQTSQGDPNEPPPSDDRDEP